MRVPDLAARRAGSAAASAVGARARRRARAPGRAPSSPPASSGRAPRTWRSAAPGCCSGRSTSGSVACFHALETCPSMPPGALASIRIATAGTTASASDEHAGGARAGARAGRPLRGEEADGEAGDRQRRRAAAATARRRPGRRRCAAAMRAPSSVSPSCANAHATSGTVATSTPPSSDQRSQPQRHEREPHASADPHRQQRAARVRRASVHTISTPSAGQASALTAAWPERRAAEPEQRRDAERGGEPDAVPVVKRRRAAARRSRRSRARRGRPWSAATRPQSSTRASATPPSSAPQRPGASRPSASPPASTAR